MLWAITLSSIIPGSAGPTVNRFGAKVRPVIEEEVWIGTTRITGVEPDGRNVEIHLQWERGPLEGTPPIRFFPFRVFRVFRG
jgi:hypothetical protein